ncbi:PREDICTED: LOW QUALITY PROTEIN: Golgi apparatus protein 1 [Habropoda laboriosa]|uniref:LOW QUALITY PROTEIN: Golgi apparatus protein 1 n=1 Tax=Habropoda laboriosa TaxID=597456 RepID=UPI00083DFA88|nr:PREDICTED: LOW QUALITY PROTEIN: Golgi apparatus protein 1 [Habropoda laboriosa]
MEYKTNLSISLVIFLHLSVLNCTHLTRTYFKDVSRNNGESIPNISWLFSNSIDSFDRVKRAVIAKGDLSDDSFLKFIKSSKCRKNLNNLCGNISENNDELMLLECIQNFKPTEVSGIDDECRQAIWVYILNITDNLNIERLAKRTCGKELDLLDCSASGDKHGAYLSCLIDQREKVKNPQCITYIQRLEWIAFSDFRIITPFSSDCENDIKKFKCDNKLPYRDISQGQILACLQEHVNELQLQCKRHILHVSEIQAENINLDRQLYLACEEDRTKFCPSIRPGSGQVYKCLMQHKTDRAMTSVCQEQLTRRGKLIASDYRVSKGLVKACKDDIKSNHCRRPVFEDKNIRLAQILLCLESAAKNGSKIDRDCQAEMFDHRKLLMEDYRLSPEIVDGCANDITTFCNSLEVGGATIHCLMEHTRTKRKKSRVSSRCNNKLNIICHNNLEELIMEADAGEDWRIDPVLREQCQPLVNLACRDMHGGDARVISCLMEQLGTERMTEACETALVQVQYFVARDFKLDPQLYRACKFDATRLCHARNAWASDGKQMDPERGPLILPCLYRHAYHPQKNLTLKTDCLEEIRRVMRQRAVNVDLQPEIEEVCLNELASFCYDKTAKGEEILCLQDNLDRLTKNCKLAVGNFTEEQAERVELNPIISAACQHIMERHCEEVLKYGKDEGDMMECLIEHKNDLDVRSDYKCKTAVEHFQLISLKNYHFTYKFKEACRPSVKRWCPKSKTKAEVIECLSTIVQEDIMKDTQHHIPKECRQQLRAQLYQQRENIQFDPILQTQCTTDIKQYCYNVEPGNSQILECLAAHKSKLSDACHKQLFKVRKQEFQDSSSDFALLNSCHLMVRQFCHDISRSQALDCLKKYKDEPTFDDKCKNIVIRRMIEQNTDYRFNTALQTACSYDINKHCKEVLLHEPTDKELEGKVIRCLKIKFREAKLTTRCEHQMTNILREAALNYHLNPLLATMCAHEIETICRADENDPGAVEECLKMEFNAGNRVMKEECRLEIADLIEETRADINVDPLLQKACAVDVSKYCSDVPQGAGRHIMCLQNVLEDSNKSLQPDCFKMLNTRIEMFRNAAKLILPNSIQELYTSVNRSPARRYFMIVALTLIGIIFITGLFCGRVTRRTMIMKNK